MKPIDKFLIPKGTGKGCLIQKGQILRISQPEGPQVADFNAFNIDNARECLGVAVTRREEGIHVTAGNNLWSCPPWERCMFKIIADTVEHKPSPDGSQSHDLLGGRCSQASRKKRYGTDTPGCNEILAAAIEPFGLTGDYVHDAFNIFMKTGLGVGGKPFWVEPDARKGDYIDLLAEMTCIVAISACPGKSSGKGAFPIGIEIFTAS